MCLKVGLEIIGLAVVIGYVCFWTEILKIDLEREDEKYRFIMIMHMMDALSITTYIISFMFFALALFYFNEGLKLGEELNVVTKNNSNLRIFFIFCVCQIVLYAINLVLLNGCVYAGSSDMSLKLEAAATALISEQISIQMFFMVYFIFELTNQQGRDAGVLESSESIEEI